MNDVFDIRKSFMWILVFVEGENLLFEWCVCVMLEEVDEMKWWLNGGG